ncbi:transcription factor S-II, central domain-containing protein [Mycena pura]|uniref:Transcription elongation factor n=1 Tax=Mycena pura TaxID=153505 RepID=A0AAD6YQW3_9AGAR|nr:transcription factor S-II, central domain-containing protein [Mycena pura]
MSSDAVELKKLVKQLQSASTNEDIVSILRILKKDFRVNEAVLRESKAGLAVGKLRTHASKDVSDLAKEIVKQWKNEVDRAKNANASASASGKPAVGITTAVRKASLASNGPATPQTPGGASANTRTMKSDGVHGPVTGDRTRDRCIELVYDALASDSGAPADLILKKAKDIEAAVFSNIGGTSQPYPTKMRSIFVNLKDKNNPGLRESVASGEISVERLAKMTSEEMASDERKKADEKIKEQNLHNALGAEETEAETSAFQCGKCKQRKCTYRQAQTRSADEPMTVRPLPFRSQILIFFLQTFVRFVLCLCLCDFYLTFCFQMRELQPQVSPSSSAVSVLTCLSDGSSPRPIATRLPTSLFALRSYLTSIPRSLTYLLQPLPF